MSNIELISIHFPWFFPTFLFLIGLCVGSFLNVCVYRMPRGLSIVWPPSFCPKSGTSLKWWENIPLLSFILLRGKGRISKEKIGWQYPALELFTGIAFAGLWVSFPHPAALCYMAMTAIFLAGSFIDWQFKIIPDSFTVGGTLLGVIVSLFVPALHGVHTTGVAASTLSLGISLLGLLVGSGVVLWLAIGAEIILKKEAMGFGDVKLLGMIGAFLGWQGALFAIFAGAIIGTAVALVTILVEKLSGKDEGFFGREIPFGPMLCAASLVWLWVQGPFISGWEHFARVIVG
jgi:leader peptidase (prepilin peptidase)/N-methyltransferase